MTKASKASKASETAQASEALQACETAQAHQGEEGRRRLIRLRPAGVPAGDLCPISSLSTGGFRFVRIGFRDSFQSVAGGEAGPETDQPNSQRQVGAEPRRSRKGAVRGNAGRVAEKPRRHKRKRMPGGISETTRQGPRPLGATLRGKGNAKPVRNRSLLRGRTGRGPRRLRLLPGTAPGEDGRATRRWLSSLGQWGLVATPAPISLRARRRFRPPPPPA